MSELSGISRGFLAIEQVVQQQAAQRESVRGKDTPFRVEFRFSHGDKSWQYFTDFDTASNAVGARCSYSPWGHAVITRPTSQRVQVRGPRGGWKPLENGDPK